LPPSPALTRIFASSMNMGKARDKGTRDSGIGLGESRGLG
jgi:hypothetical protein